MYVCKAYLWNKESLMVYNLERKQKRIKMFTRIPFAMIQFSFRTGLHESTFCDSLGTKDKSPPACDFKICTKLRIFAVPVLQNFTVPVFCCSVFRCSGVPLFLVLLIAPYCLLFTFSVHFRVPDFLLFFKCLLPFPFD